MASPYLLSFLFLAVLGIWENTYGEDQETVKVDVYYESLCPDSRRFFLRQLWPTYKKLETRLDLSFIPYGNAEVWGTPGNWSFACQHGTEECLGNIIQTCAVEIMNSTTDSLKFIVCAFNSRSQSKIIKNCIRSADLQDEIQKCADGSMGNNLEYEMAKKTDALDPPQNFIPWITINGNGSGSINMQANYNLLDLVCKQFQEDTPDVCTRRRRYVESFFI